jgi:hypothetical protein
LVNLTLNKKEALGMTKLETLIIDQACHAELDSASLSSSENSRRKSTTRDRHPFSYLPPQV